MYRRGKHGIWQISVSGVRQSSGTADRERAKTLEHKLNAEAWDRKNGLIIPTWDQACISWIDDNPEKAQKEIYLHMLKWWKPHLSGKRLDAITPKFIHQIMVNHRGISVTERIKQNATANLYSGFAGRVIRACSNLKPKFQSYPPNLGNDRWVTPEEWALISARLTDDERDILTFTLATGQREANMMFFDWPWWKGDSAQIPATATKTKAPYGIPLNKTAQAILEKRRQKPIRHVRYAFTNQGVPWHRVRLLRAMATACKAAGVPYATVHSLRHTFGTWLAMKGVPKDIRKRLMGHAGQDVHDRYIHYDVETLRPYANLIDEMLTRKEVKIISA